IYRDVPRVTSRTLGAAGCSTRGLVAMSSQFRTTVITLSDDVSVVKGTHQFAFGASLMGFESNSKSYSFSPGSITVNGSVTGLPLADFMAGRILNIQHGAPNKLLV